MIRFFARRRSRSLSRLINSPAMAASVCVSVPMKPLLPLLHLKRRRLSSRHKNRRAYCQVLRTWGISLARFRPSFGKKSERFRTHCSLITPVLNMSLGIVTFKKKTNCGDRLDRHCLRGRWTAVPKLRQFSIALWRTNPTEQIPLGVLSLLL